MRTLPGAETTISSILFLRLLTTAVLQMSLHGGTRYSEWEQDMILVRLSGAIVVPVFRDGSTNVLASKE